jgi:hypothetical protein
VVLGTWSCKHARKHRKTNPSAFPYQEINKTKEKPNSKDFQGMNPSKEEVGG